MRLIDLDEFAALSRRWVPDLSSVEKAINENDIWDLGYLECIKVIDACHVYKNLIPVEWIKKWLDNIKNDKRYKSEYIELIRDITKINYEGTEIIRVPSITDMLEDWEKEKEAEHGKEEN